jgi:sec-independent protein translocase protein TatB
MFDISWTELIVVGVVALIAIGPKELPGALRSLGQWMGKIRRMASEFQGQFQEAMREAEMAELKKQVDTLTSGFDPIESARKEIEGAVDEKAATATAPADAWSDPTAAPADAVPAAEAPPGADAPAVTAEPPAPADQPSDDLTPQPAGGRA